LKIGLYGSGRVDTAMDSIFVHAYSRRRKAGVSDRGARVGKVERTAYALGWRIHTIATQERLPLAYIVRSANVNDKVPAPKLLDQALSILKKAKSAIRMLIAEAQYYSEDFFNVLEGFGILPLIPAPPQIKQPLIHLRVKRGFIVDGDRKLVRLYHRRMIVEHVFKPGKRQLNLDNLTWRGVARVRMHIALCY